jgi:hypothetical protein
MTLEPTDQTASAPAQTAAAVRKISIAPSDFGYLFRECPRCTADKLLRGIRRPPTPFPGVFSKMDRLMRDEFAGFPTQHLGDGSWPAGTLDTGWSKVRSAQIDFPEFPQFTFSIGGTPDAVAVFDNGDLGILDFKVSGYAPKEDRELYRAQLSAYALAVEDMTGKKVTHTGLYVASPKAGQLTILNKEKRYEHPNPSTLFDVNLVNIANPSTGRAFIISELYALATLLATPEAQVSAEKCGACVYRRRVIQEALSGAPESPVPPMQKARESAPEVADYRTPQEVAEQNVTGSLPKRPKDTPSAVFMDSENELSRYPAKPRRAAADSHHPSLDGMRGKRER